MHSGFQQRSQLVLSQAADKARQAAQDVSAVEWEWLLEYASGMSKMERLLGQAASPKADWESVFSAGVVRRLKGEPIQYILEEAHFYGRKFSVGPSVLIPRPETELLVEWAVGMCKGQTNPAILDIGTGSGCIAVSMALEVPGSKVTAIDNSEKALSMARLNADLLNASVDFLNVDVLQAPLPSIPPGSFTMILSNPPYVPVEELASMQLEVREFEPHDALFAGSDPLTFYRVFTVTLAAQLRPKGYIGMEIHANYGLEVADLFIQQGWKNVSIKQDLAGMDRFVIASVD